MTIQMTMQIKVNLTYITNFNMTTIKSINLNMTYSVFFVNIKISTFRKLESVILISNTIQKNDNLKIMPKLRVGINLQKSII